MIKYAWDKVNYCMDYLIDDILLIRYFEYFYFIANIWNF